MAAPVLNSQGTLTASGGEDNVFTLGAPGIYEVRINLANMAAGDTVILRRYVEDPSTSSAVIAEQVTLTGPQSPVRAKVFGPFGVATASILTGVTLEQTAGTLRDFGTSVINY